MTNADFMKPFETMKSLMTAQAEVISKTVSLQQKSGEELTSFIKSEMEKAQSLKSPEDVLKFNTESSAGLFELLKAQGEAYKAVAEDAQAAMMEEVSKLTK
jgi:predicted DsbA family dithiol-disulfide isomerase